MERLHKFLAHCGVASRRKAEEYILEGRVSVNGEVITELGVKIDPGKDRIKVDGKVINAEQKVYYLLHKPRGYTTTAEDEFGRRTVVDLMEGVSERVYPAGRLDRESSGLIVMTNDGDLSYFLTHPSKGVKKVYEAVVEGEVSDSMVEDILEKGVRLGPVLVKPSALKILNRKPDKTVLKITVAEGINREVRRLFAVLDHEVKKLSRIEIGPLSLKGISRGTYRKFTRRELEIIMSWIERGGSDEAAEVAEKLRRYRGVRLNKPSGKPDPAENRKFSADKKRGAKSKGKKFGKYSGRPQSSSNSQVAAGNKRFERRPDDFAVGESSGFASENKRFDRQTGKKSGHNSTRPNGESSGRRQGRPSARAQDGRFDRETNFESSSRSSQPRGGKGKPRSENSSFSRSDNRQAKPRGGDRNSASGEKDFAPARFDKERKRSSGRAGNREENFSDRRRDSDSGDRNSTPARFGRDSNRPTTRSGGNREGGGYRGKGKPAGRDDARSGVARSSERPAHVGNTQRNSGYKAPVPSRKKAGKPDKPTSGGAKHPLKK